MNFDLNLTVDNLVKDETKEERITTWDKLFQKYERISKETTIEMNVEDIEKVYLENPEENFKPFKSRIVKKKRSRPKSRKVNTRNKRSKVSKLDNNVNCVVKPICVSEELVADVTHINTIEEFKSHPELVDKLTNHKFFYESDSSGELLTEDDSPECGIIGDTKLLNVQDCLNGRLLSVNLKKIDTDVAQADKSSEIKLGVKSDNIVDKPTNRVNLEDQDCQSKDLVSEWLNNSEPFKQCRPTKHDDIVYFKEPLASSVESRSLNNDVFDLETKSHHCNGECKRQNIGEELFSKRTSRRSKRHKFCTTCSNHKSPEKVNICPTKREDIKKLTILSNSDSSNNLLNHNQKHIYDFSNKTSRNDKSLQGLIQENRLKEELLRKDTTGKCKQAKVSITSKEVEICHTKQDSPKVNETYYINGDSELPNIKTLKQKALLNLDIQSDDLNVTDETNNTIVQDFKMGKFLMSDMFYKRSKQLKVAPSFTKVDVCSTKENNAEPVVNWIKKLKSPNNPVGFTKTLTEKDFKKYENNRRKDDHGLVKNNHRTSNTNNQSGSGQFDESFGSSSRMNSIISLSGASQTSTPIKDREKFSNHNKDEENYLKIKNKIENELQSKLGYMAYKRHELHQNSGASNREEIEFWEKSVRREIRKLSRVIPATVLLRYMKEFINLRMNSSGMIGNASRSHKNYPRRNISS